MYITIMTAYPKIHRPTAATLLALAALAVIAGGCGKTAERNDAAPAADTVQTAAAAATLDTVSGTFTDSRDGKTYRTVRIGNQTWMAENLNYKTGKSVCYDKKKSNCQKYGRLYDWNTAMKACPAGWHLPSDKEWTALTDFVGGEDTAGTKLKSKTGWYPMDTGYKAATDDYGFSALPGGVGYRRIFYYGFTLPGDFDYGHNFHRAGYRGNWWSATENGASLAWYRCMCYYDDPGVGRDNNDKTDLYSVRCLRDFAAPQ